jgi:hypothetical protein
MISGREDSLHQKVPAANPGSARTSAEENGVLAAESLFMINFLVVLFPVY